MQIHPRATAALLLAVISAHTTMSAVGSRKAEYAGGSVPVVREPVEGALDTTAETHMAFFPDGGKAPAMMFPYPAITALEYGPAAGRRVAVALLVKPLTPAAKTRRHFLTITYRDDTNQEQAVVFELGSVITRSTLRIMATRSGKPIEYQDEEARKAGRGSN